MIFLGYSAFLGNNTDYQTPVEIDNINKIVLSNAVFDDLFITNDVSQDLSSPLNTAWDWSTIFHATFNNTLSAGNVDFVLNQISSIRVKYRKYGTTDWITLTDVSIFKNEDLSFIRYCKWCQGNKTPYEFALVPISPSGIEGNYNTNTIVSDFNYLFVMSKDQTFKAINEEITPTKNQDTIVLKPLTGKFPVVISNDELDYYSFSVKCMFITKINNVFDKLGALQYRKQAVNLLSSKTPLLIKLWDGRMWLVAVTDAIADDSTNYSYEGYTMTTFQCCEIGNANNYDDLTENGLISI